MEELREKFKNWKETRQEIVRLTKEDMEEASSGGDWKVRIGLRKDDTLR